MCLGENLERKRERICPKKAPNSPISFSFSFLSEDGLGVFIGKKVTLQLLMKAFPSLDWVDLGVPRKVWMCSF